MGKLKQKTTAKIHQSPLGSAIPKASQKFPYGPHRSEFNAYIRFHPTKHLPEDERSLSRRRQFKEHDSRQDKLFF